MKTKNIIWADKTNTDIGQDGFFFYLKNLKTGLITKLKEIDAGTEESGDDQQ